MSPSDITEVGTSRLLLHTDSCAVADSPDPAARGLHDLEHEDRPGRALHRVRTVRAEPRQPRQGRSVQHIYLFPTDYLQLVSTGYLLNIYYLLTGYPPNIY